MRTDKYEFIEQKISQLIEDYKNDKIDKETGKKEFELIKNLIKLDI